MIETRTLSEYEGVLFNLVNRKISPRKFLSSARAVSKKDYDVVQVLLKMSVPHRKIGIWTDTNIIEIFDGRWNELDMRVHRSFFNLSFRVEIFNIGSIQYHVIYRDEEISFIEELPIN